MEIKKQTAGTDPKDASKKETHFHKLFLREFINALEPVADKKTRFCFWILDNVNKNNVLDYTYRQMEAKSGYSYRIVADTMKMLLDRNFLRKRPSGGYMVNPDIIFWGSYDRRCFALKKYYDDCIMVKHEDGHKKAAGRERLRLRDIRKSIDRLQKQEILLLESINEKTAIDDEDGDADNQK